MKPVKDDPQGIGSCITYMRRYALSAVAGIAPEDDDGNAASGKTQAVTTQSKTIGKPLSGPKPVGQPSAEGTASRGAVQSKPSTDDPYIDLGQQANFAKSFRDSLQPHLQKQSESLKHQWLMDHGYASIDNEPSSKWIRVSAFMQARLAACEWASKQQ